MRSRLRAALIPCGLLLATATFSAIAGDRFHVAEKTLVKLRIADYAEIRADEGSIGRDNFLQSPIKVACPQPGPRTMVVALLGQSNAANYAEHRTQANDGRISVFYRGQCYEATDPLLGATGFRGSVWPTFAKKMIASGQYSQVVLVPAAIGGTDMDSWAPGGIFWDRVLSRIYQLRGAGLALTHIFISQGERESDLGKDGVDYQRFAIDLLSSLKSETAADVYLATTGRCNRSQNLAIRRAQQNARAATGTFAGPDMDLIGPEHRVRGCHLDDYGVQKVASGWADAVLKSSNKGRLNQNERAGDVE